jgi:hypothetical protein
MNTRTNAVVVLRVPSTCITSDDNLILAYYYVGIPTRTPDRNTENCVKSGLAKLHIKFSQLVAWNTTNCPQG